MVEKKKFLEFELPLIKQRISLLANTEKDLLGRTIKIDLTRKLRGKSLEAIFKIYQENGKIKILPYRLHIQGYFIRRMMRKSIDYVEDSFSTQTNDAVLRVKLFLITRKKVSNRVKKALRMKAKEEIQTEFGNKDCGGIFSDILSGKLQKSLSIKLKKIYPLAFFDITDIYLEKEKQEIELKTEKIK